MASSEPRRFYALADVAATQGGFRLRLDGRPVFTPAGRALVAPSRALAELLAEEWRAQGQTIALSRMPATRLAHAAVDAGAGHREAQAEAFVEFAGADLLCYFAEGPASLAARQHEAWTPILKWADEAFDLAFETTRGVVHRPQPIGTLERMKAIACARSDFELAGLAFAAALFGSAVLALALWAGRIDGGEAFAASRVDERFQEDRWGLDAEAAARSKPIADEAQMLERWFAALR